MQTVDGLALPKKSAKEEAAAMTTVDITWVPSTAFIRSVSTNLHDPGGGSFLFGNISLILKSHTGFCNCLYL